MGFGSRTGDRGVKKRSFSARKPPCQGGQKASFWTKWPCDAPIPLGGVLLQDRGAQASLEAVFGSDEAGDAGADDDGVIVEVGVRRLGQGRVARLVTLRTTTLHRPHGRRSPFLFLNQTVCRLLIGPLRCIGTVVQPFIRSIVDAFNWRAERMEWT